MRSTASLLKKFKELYKKHPTENEFSQFEKNYFGGIPMCIKVDYKTPYVFNGRFRDYLKKIEELGLK